jgi:hypothetical protein
VAAAAALLSKLAQPNQFTSSVPGNFNLWSKI